MSLFEPIFEALNRAQVRYVVVGGFEALAFVDPATRYQWIHEKGMRVFSMWDGTDRKSST